MKKRLFSLLTVIALISLIVIRLFVREANGWISYLNYIGLVIAVWGFLIEFSSQYRKHKVANFIKGLLVIVIAILIILGCLITTEIIGLNTLANDEILLLTLLISLPANYYCELLGKIINYSDKHHKKEYTYGAKK